MDKNKLAEILEKHNKWCKNEVGGECANLHGADLCGVNLCGADLPNADLSSANLCYIDLFNANLDSANLCCADLPNADLGSANLCYTDLHNANLHNVNLCCANLRNADLHNANLYIANLYDADLRDADLRCADLRSADLSGADFRGADLRGANLYNAILCGAKFDQNIIEKVYPLCCPEIGEFIGWKKVTGDYIVKLKITEEAKRSSAYGRKCRCSEAEVLAIENIDGTKANVDIVFSRYDSSFEYKVGEIVKPTKPFDENRFNECASGIHFFITREEAVNYEL